MKSNFKNAQNKTADDDELFTHEHEMNLLKSSRELIEAQKLTNLSP